jgi:hypothetical protein
MLVHDALDQPRGSESGSLLSCWLNKAGEALGYRRQALSPEAVPGGAEALRIVERRGVKTAHLGVQTSLV